MVPLLRLVVRRLRPIYIDDSLLNRPWQSANLLVVRRVTFPIHDL